MSNLFRLLLKPKTVILEAGHPILRKRSKKVEDIKSILHIADLLKSNIDSKTIGLSAPQIGYNLRIIAYTNNKSISILINPKWSPITNEKQVRYETCESVPYYNALVERYKNINVNGQDLSGEQVSFKATDLLSTVIQHECDHLDGILIVDRMVPQSLRRDHYVGEFDLVNDKKSTTQASTPPLETC